VVAIELTLRLPAFIDEISSAHAPHSKALKLAQHGYGFGDSCGWAKGASPWKAFNLRRDFAKDDTLPRRFTDEEQIPGNKKSKFRWVMMPRYYQLRGLGQ